MQVIIFLAMICCNLIADYNLQGILAQMKQRSWWKENYPDELYAKDWICALIEHSFMWSFITHLPLIWYYWGNNDKLEVIFVLIIVQMVIHAIIDHLKANKKVISLYDDQSMHLLQIFVSWRWLL